MKKTIKKYAKGVRLERKIVNYARDKGLIGFRSAGSKSGSKAKIDCVIIDTKQKKIYIIQAKARKLSHNALKRELELLPRNDEYVSKRLIITNLKELKEIL